MIFGRRRTPTPAALVLGVAAGISRGRVRLSRCQETETAHLGGRSGTRKLLGKEGRSLNPAEEGAGAAAPAPGSGGARGVGVALGRDELGAGVPRGWPCR